MMSPSGSYWLSANSQRSEPTGEIVYVTDQLAGSHLPTLLTVLIRVVGSHDDRDVVLTGAFAGLAAGVRGLRKRCRLFGSFASPAEPVPASSDKATIKEAASALANAPKLRGTRDSDEGMCRIAHPFGGPGLYKSHLQRQGLAEAMATAS